jgi:hypothetical protein
MFPETLSNHHRATHTYVIGQPGTGKSRALESWVMQDIAAGRGVAVIDPHGDLFNNLLCRIAELPRVWERVVIIDPMNPMWIVGLNPLEPVPGVPSERIATHLTDVVTTLWHLNPASAPRMVRLLSNAFLALVELRLTLVDLSRFLLDPEFRKGQLAQLGNSRVKEYFEYEFPNNPAAVHQWIAPVLNKLGRLVFDPDVRPMLAEKKTVDFRGALDQGLILLANLPKGQLGESTSALLAAFIVARLQQAALARTSTRHRPPFYLYLDEFQGYTTENIETILAESRKYALCLTFAHQYLDQLSPRIRSAVLNTSGTLISFRVGYHDALVLAKEIFPGPDFATGEGSRLGLHIREAWKVPTVQDELPPRDWDRLAQALFSLGHRQFWVSRRGDRSPMKLRTIDMPVPKLSAVLTEKVDSLLETSGSRFGRLKRGTWREWDEDYSQGSLYRGGASSQDEDNLPFWDE